MSTVQQPKEIKQQSPKGVNFGKEKIRLFNKTDDVYIDLCDQEVKSRDASINLNDLQYVARDTPSKK